MSWLQVVVLSVLQGLTEFLPVSSSGHLAIASRVFFADDAGASFTAVTQLGTEFAVLVYFARDIVRIVKAWCSGLLNNAARNADYRLGWYVIIGTIPIGLLGLLFKDEIRTGARNLWLIASALVVFSAVIAAAERFGRQTRDVEQLTWRDSVTVGLAQCLALVPGVSRSGATISAGLLRGVERVTATKLAFYLGIPALVGAGVLETPKALGQGVGALPTAVGTVVSFVVAYASVAWLLRFVSTNRITAFVPYRIVLGIAIIITLAAGWLAAT